MPPRPETCGRTEEMIGRWLQARGCREKVVLASKVMGGAKVGGPWVRVEQSMDWSMQGSMGAC